MRRLFSDFEKKQRPIFEIQMNVTGKKELIQAKHWDKMLCCMRVRRAGLCPYGADHQVEEVMLNALAFLE